MFLKKIIIINICFILFSCNFKPAPIENHSGDFYTKANEYNKNKYSDYNFGRRTRYSSPSETKIQIKAGDTLYEIANSYNVDVRDLIKENNLSAPYVLKSGSYLVLPQANYHIVKSGETLYSISRDYAINLNEIVSLNELKAPYNIYVSQKLKISNDKIQLKQASSRPVKNYDSKPKEQNFVSRILNKKDNHFSWPIKGKIISDFGPKKGGLYNDGINITAPLGSEVKSAEDGVVAYVGNELKGYGNLIILKHSGGWISAYGHLSKTSVQRGEKIAKSQTIALSGATGNVDSSQLYFALRKGRDAVNPKFYLEN